MSGSFGLPAIPTFLSIEKNEQAAAAKSEAGDTTANAAVAQFTKAASGFTTPQQLLGDYRSLTVVLGAFGMTSMIGQTAILRKLLTEDPTSSTSLAASSGNPLWSRFAKLMSGWTATSTPFSSASAVSTISNQFLEAAFETNQGKAIPGMANALYFARTAGSVTTIPGLMADGTQLNVVEVSLGIDPNQFGVLDFDQQQTTLSNQVDLESFATPAGITRIAEQYLALTAQNPPATAQTYDVASLFSDDGSGDLLGIIGQSLTTSG